MNLSLQQRLTARLAPDAETGCLLWTGARNSSGYGLIRVHNYPHLVHRVAWELENGPIGDGMTIDHVWARGCFNRNCANVAHMEVVTSRENTLRGNSAAARNAVKTHCPKGHPYDDQNTYLDPRGKRNCRTCARLKDMRRVRRRT